MEEVGDIKITFYPANAERRISESDLARHAEAAWARSRLYAHAAVMWETLIPTAYKAADAGERDLYTAIMASKCIREIEAAMLAAGGDDDVYDYGRFVIEAFRHIKTKWPPQEDEDDE